MADIFRKSSLEKLSSPEQLDKMIVITPSSFWLSMVGAGIIIVVALIWSIFGRLPQNVDAQGIYINRAGIQSVYCEGSGTVSEPLAEDGDTVKKGDVIAILDTSEVDKKIREYEEKKAAVENVTTETVSEIGNLIDEDSVLSLYQDLFQNLNMLKYQTEELETKRTALAKTEDKYLDLESKYYKSFNVGDSTTEQLAYQEAQSALSAANSYLESAKNAYEQAKEQYNAAKDAYDAALEAADDDEDDPSVVANKSTLDAAKKTLDKAESTYNDYLDKKDTAQSDYEKAKNEYIKKIESIGATQSKQSELGNRYNVLANQYNSEKSAVKSLEDSIAQTKVQIEVIKAYILSNLTTEYKQYLDQIEMSQIKATADGRISDLAVAPGSVIGQGTEIAKIQKGDSSDRIVMCYIPVSEGRKVQAGMKVLIYPSTVNKQEYGHMEATVLNVDEYITSAADMQKQLGDNNLVEAFMQNGPVVAVVCELKADASTASGYYWSSYKGASVNIDGGTMVEASVVVSEKAPISMLIPFLKEKLTIKADK